jgi:hypothetical protein
VKLYISDILGDNDRDQGEFHEGRLLPA